MALIKSISGIRGTIGGIPGTALTPLDIVRFTAAYAQFIRQQSDTERLTIVVGRDARISGAMVNTLVTGTLLAMGVDVIDTGLSTTPTVEVSVINIKADGGIIITASHNPAQWNALKLLNHHGEFLSAADGEEILRLADSDEIHFAEATALGTLIERHDTIQEHIRQVLALDLVDVEAIRKANFKVAVDAVNSTGGIAIPALLEALGVKEIKKIYCDPDGDFPHNPEPLPENLTEIAKVMRQGNYDVGFVVDPDVDRLAIICENGEMFGEEYTLVAVADYVLSHTPGNTVSNLSSSRALRDVTVAAGGSYQASAVGEVNVVELMKKTNAVIGGEGNGGIIYPAAHYGRDALVGIALFLTFMAKEKATPTEIRKRYPAYFISKNKIQ
ncbi:MAG: phosphoglucosamine mutase, partial [Clostridia bacterium]|nr:phosphoglucosamine mutase [Clostridia bacterium]